MLRFVQLKIKGANGQLRQLLTSWKNDVPKGWKYDKNRSESLARNLSVDILDCAFFKAPTKLFEAKVCVVIDNESLRVVNIVSEQYFSLGKDRYNAILSAFYSAFVKEETKATFNVFLSKAEQSLQELVNDKTANALELWESLCNKGDGGICHPCDRERWFGFVMTAFRTNSEIDLDILEQWLVEEKSWPSSDNEEDDRTEKLLLYFEYGRDLLEYYEKNNYK